MRPRLLRRRGRIPGLEKPVSPLALGTAHPEFPEHGSPVLDAFFEAGGNCIESAWIYGEGASETAIGQWLDRRGVRSETVVITKGAPHDPVWRPEHLGPQLEESLERLGLESVEVLLSHRDNAAVPAGEYVDAFNRLRQAGRIKVFGASNWSVARMRAANEYAAANGLEAMSVLSNQLSLARMVEPPWDGTLSAGDQESRRWLTETQTVLLAWSSQARGFFARGDRGDTSDAELVRCWHSDDNFARLARARNLARARGTTATAIALAYLLHQPFPTIPVIGPRNAEELHSSLAAVDVRLSARETGWLNLEDA